MGEVPAETRKPLLGVSTAVFRQRQDRVEILLVERGSGGALAGRLSFPGGKVRLGERLAEAAARELREETGLIVEADALSFLRLHEAIGEDYHAVIAVHAVSMSGDGRPHAGDDAVSAAFHSLTTVEELEAAERTTPGLAGIAHQAAKALGWGD